MNRFTSRNPVLLIHGINGSTYAFRTMMPQLRDLSCNVYGLNLTPNDGIGLEQLAQQVADYIDRTFIQEQPIDLIGYSMGGLVSRYYVQYLGGINRVQRLITISSPHAGTWMAYLRNNPGCKQMRPRSNFLRNLDRKSHILAQINFTSIWTPFDVLILPASSSQISVGRGVKVAVLRHGNMPTAQKTLEVVVEALLEQV